MSTETTNWRVSTTRGGEPENPFGGGLAAAGNLPEVVPCRECGQLIQQESWQLFLATVCPRCAPVVERRYADEAVDKQRQERAKEAEARRQAWEEVYPTRYRAEIDPTKLYAQGYYRAVAWSYNSGRGLLLHGDTRQGKTRTMWSILHREHEAGREIAVYTCNDFAKEVADAAREKRERSLSRWLCREADIVALDDFGNSKLTPTYETELLDMIEKRMAWNRPVIITTQHVGGSLLGQKHWHNFELAKAVVARLREWCDCVAFGGEGD